MIHARSITFALALISIGCSRPGQSSTPHRARSAERYPTTTLGSGYMAPRFDAGARGVVVAIASPEAWLEFEAAMREDLSLHLDEALGGRPSFDPARAALLFVEFPDNSGSELRAVVDGFERDGSVGRVHGRWVDNPKGAMTDDLNRSWVLVEVPAAAIVGDPVLSLELAN